MIITGRPWRVFIAGGLLAVLTYGAALLLITREQARLHNQEIQRQLLTTARLLGHISRTAPDDSLGRTALSELGAGLEAEGLHVIILDSAGRIRLDSTGTADPQALQTAPEVRDAHQTPLRHGTDVRPWGPDNRAHVIVAATFSASPGGAQELVWLAQPKWSLAAHPATLGQFLAIAALLSAIATLALLLLHARLRRRVLLRAIQTVRHLSTGDLTVQAEDSPEEDLASLATALNALRRRLASQVELIDRQRWMLQSLLDHLQEGIVVAREDGRIVLINPTAVRLLNIHPPGVDPATLVGRPVETCIPQHPLQRLLTLCEPLPAPDGTDATETDPVAETRLEVETDNGTVQLLARASQVALAETDERTTDSGVGRVVMLTDITELQRTIQMRTDFVANASHELRTPLSTIRAAVETLLTMDLQTEAPAAKTFLEKIDRHSLRLELMVGDLLDLSRIETPSERFEPEPVETRRLLQDVHARFAERLEHKQLHWAQRLEPPSAHTMHVNPHLLRLALDNLVDNAIKFTEPGGCIELHLAVASASVTLTVTDTGCGIPEDEQQRVFERFYQVQRSRSGPERGTGLGLSIVRHAVGAMRGTVSLSSVVGQGTSVTMTVPQSRD